MSLKSTRAQWYENVAVLLESGHGVPKAFDLASKVSSGNFGKSLGRLRLHLQQGSSVGEAVEQAHAEVPAFSALERTVIRYAEQAGRLPEALRHLGEWCDAVTAMKRKCVLGMLLPLLVWHVAAFVTPIPHAVGPSGDGVFGYVLAVVGYLLLLYVPVALGVLLWKVAQRRDDSSAPGPVSRFALGLILKVPMVGAGIRDAGLSIFMRVFHLLHDAGVPVQDCVRGALRSCRANPIYPWLSATQTAVDNHEPVSQGFSPSVPVAVKTVWLSAEEAGSFHTSLPALADQLWADAKHALNGAVAMGMALVYIVMMGFMVVAIFRSAVGTIIPVIEDM